MYPQQPASCDSATRPEQANAPLRECIYFRHPQSISSVYTSVKHGATSALKCTHTSLHFIMFIDLLLVTIRELSARPCLCNFEDRVLNLVLLVKKSGQKRFPEKLNIFQMELLSTQSVKQSQICY